MVQLSITKQRSEDPLIVLLDTVVSKHRLFLAATDDAHEWTTRVIVKRGRATRRRFSAGINHIRDWGRCKLL